MVICAGDFFDKPGLTPDEITALQDIEWADITHHFLVGNHESDEADLRYSSTKALEQPGFFIEDKAKFYPFIKSNFELCFLPYVVERDRKAVADYFPRQLEGSKRLIISHNDLFGIQLGPCVSVEGFKPEDLEANCDLCINGHLHNAPKATNKVINLVNLTGKDFGEDASKIPHGVLIFDTDTFTYKFVENPYAFNFYKLEIHGDDFRPLVNLKNNSVVSIKAEPGNVQAVREAVAALSTIIESRIIITREIVDGEAAEDITDLTVDQYVKFAECCREKLENTPILEAELAEILK